MVCKAPVKATVALLLICTISFCVRSFDGNNNGKDHLPASRRVEDQDQPQQQAQRSGTIIDTPPSSIIDTAKTLFSLPDTRLALLQAAASNYWIKLKTLLLKQTHDHPSSAPTLDFRSEDNDQVEGSADGAGEKVKEAVTKSLDKSKVAIEDSARSAAKFARDAMDKTTKKVKKTLSDASSQSDAEL